MLGLTYKTAWFMCHRIRFAMDKGPLAEMLTGTVEVDETYVGGKAAHLETVRVTEPRGSSIRLTD